jgi:hypothetical protein
MTECTPESSGCYSVYSVVGTFLLVFVLASHWLEDFANFTPTLEKNDQYSANHSQ